MGRRKLTARIERVMSDELEHQAASISRAKGLLKLQTVCQSPEGIRDIRRDVSRELLMMDMELKRCRRFWHLWARTTEKLITDFDGDTPAVGRLRFQVIEGERAA